MILILSIAILPLRSSQNKEYYKRIHQLEKLCKKLQGKVLKEAAAEFAIGKRMDSLMSATVNIGKGLLDFKEATTGYGAQLAFEAIEQDRDEEDRRGQSAIVRLNEVSNKNVVVKNLEEAAAKANCPQILSGELSHLATKLSRPKAIDFDATEVAHLVEDILLMHGSEIDTLSSEVNNERVLSMKPKSPMRSLGSIVFTKAVLEDIKKDSADAVDISTKEFGLTLKDILRLELYRLMGGGSGAGGGNKRGDLAGYLDGGENQRSSWECVSQQGF